VSSILFFCLSAAAGWSAPPPVRWGSLSFMLPLGSGDHLCSALVVLLWKWLFTMLVYWGLVSLPLPLSLGQGQCSLWPPWCYYGSWFIFQFCGAVWLWLWLTGSGDELSDPLPAVPQGVTYHLLLAPLYFLSALSACVGGIVVSIATFPMQFQWSFTFCCAVWSIECLAGRFGAGCGSCISGGIPQVFSV
jgi:hypothetical protein